ncbi:MAG: prepilin peptidase [Firmicutes bacterium]|nr:prepilin peptidase [Bacillota bacterium]
MEYFVFVIGLLFGSFANVVIYRLPRKISVIKPPSACPSCQRRLSAVDLVPIFSWVILHGRCRMCKAKISVRYPLVELMCGLLFASMARFSPTLSVIPLCIFAFVLLTVSFIDRDTREIPDVLLIFGAIASVLWVALPYSLTWQNALLGVIAGAVPLLLIDRIALLLWKKDGFGYGDVKLMAVVGIFLGWQATLWAFFFAILVSFPFAVYLMIKQRLSSDENFDGYMAFGPFLCIGAIMALWLYPLISHQ